MPGLRLAVSATLPGAAVLEAEPGYAPTAAEAGFIARVETQLAELAKALPPATDDLHSDFKAAHDRCVARLKECAEAVLAAPAGPARDAAAEAQRLRTHRIEGFHEIWLVQIRGIPFTVDLLEDKPAQDGGAMLAHDIRIRVRNVRVPPERQKLKLEVDRAATVVKAVLLERSRRGESFWDYALGTHRRRDAAERLDHHMRRLAGIARVGLMNTDPSQVAFAELSLAQFKEEFVALEAAQVKNTYVLRLGWYALVVLALAVFGWLVTAGAEAPTVAARFRNFFLLAAGAAAGAWLSFALRRVALTFPDLALLEEDRLNPGLRVLFVVALTLVVGLLLWTKMVTFGVGGFNGNIQGSGSHAVLLGLLSGIAERGVATAVGARAQQFGTAIGTAKVP